MGLNVLALRVLAWRDLVVSRWSLAARSSSRSPSRSIRRASPSTTASTSCLNRFLGGLGWRSSSSFRDARTYFAGPVPDGSAPDLLGRDDPHFLPNGPSHLRFPLPRREPGAMHADPRSRTRPSAYMRPLPRSTRSRSTSNRNEILSVIGPNGAGNWTIFKLISSFVKPSRGEVTFNGEVISGPRALHRRAQRCGAHVSGDNDLQGHDGARQRHRRPPPALACKPLRLLSWVGDRASR